MRTSAYECGLQVRARALFVHVIMKACACVRHQEAPTANLFIHPIRSTIYNFVDLTVRCQSLIRISRFNFCQEKIVVSHEYLFKTPEKDVEIEAREYNTEKVF